MQSVYDFLSARLSGAERLAILGAGSVLRADDGAGVYIVENLQEAFGDKNPQALLFCNGETAPENFSGKIKRFMPTHLLVIDAADVGKTPGDIVEIRPGDVGGPTFCTHMLPLRVMIEYLARETGAQVTLLGIQTKDITFDGEMTPEVQGAVDELTAALERVVSLLAR